MAEVEAHLPPRPSYGGVLDKLEFRRDWCRRNDRPDEEALWKARIERLTARPKSEVDEPARFLLSPDIDRRIGAVVAYGGSVSPDLDPSAAEFQIGDGRLWEDRFDAERRNRVPEERTIAGLARRYLEQHDLRRLAEDLSHGEYYLIGHHLRGFVGWIGEGYAPEVITPTRWEDWWKYLLKRVGDKEISPTYATKYMKYARRFIAWMASMGLMAVPSNLYNKGYKFPAARKALVTFTVDEVKIVVGAAPGQLKLHLFLMITDRCAEKLTLRSSPSQPGRRRIEPHGVCAEGD